MERDSRKIIARLTQEGWLDIPALLNCGHFDPKVHIRAGRQPSQILLTKIPYERMKQPPRFVLLSTQHQKLHPQRTFLTIFEETYR